MSHLSSQKNNLVKYKNSLATIIVARLFYFVLLKEINVIWLIFFLSENLFAILTFLP